MVVQFSQVKGAVTLPLFGGRETKKRGHIERAHPRVKKPFKVQYSLDKGETMMQALAVDISVGGIGLLTSTEIKLNEFLVQLTLEDRTVTALVSKAAAVPGKLRGSEAWRVGGKFIGITADHWDTLARFVSDQPMQDSDQLKLDLTALSSRPDDAKRLLPKSALERLLSELVKLNRLAPLSSVEPLVKLRYLGKTRRQGVEMHALRVESRVVKPHHVNNYVTQLYFDDQLKRIVTIPMENQIPEKT